MITAILVALIFVIMGLHDSTDSDLFSFLAYIFYGVLFGVFFAIMIGLFSYILPTKDVVESVYYIQPINMEYPYLTYENNRVKYILFETIDSEIINLYYENLETSSECNMPKIVVSRKRMASKVLSKFIIDLNDTKTITVYLPSESKGGVARCLL